MNFRNYQQNRAKGFASRSVFDVWHSLAAVMPAEAGRWIHI
jgi:hypothetical protein